MKLQETFYLWGQSPNSHYGYGFGESRMTPMEGCRFFGIDRCCRVAMGGVPKPPFDEESRALAPLKEVIWSIVGPAAMTSHDDGRGDLDEVIRQARMFPNITGGVLDDFFVHEARRKAFPPEKLENIRREMREKVGRPLDLWVVVYEINLDLPLRDHLAVCDVATFWTWRSSQNLPDAAKNFDRFCEMTPGKRHMNGLYLYDYGNHAPLPMELMKRQCALYEKWLLEGRSEGLIVCSNCCADVGLETVPWVRDWLCEIGQEEISIPGNRSKTE